MGVLREQSIPSFFQGVSRQPDPVRYVGQVESAENVTFSVETGGFSKRLGTTTLAGVEDASGLTGQPNYTLHSVVRSPDEKYLIVHRDGLLKIYNRITGAEVPWSVEDPDDANFFNVWSPRLRFLTIANYTFILNTRSRVRLTTVEDSVNPGEPPVPVPTSSDTYGVVELYQYTQGPWFTPNLTIRWWDEAGTQRSFGTNYTAGYEPRWEEDDGGQIVPSAFPQVATADLAMAEMVTVLNGLRPDTDWEFYSSGDTLFVRNTAGTRFEIEGGSMDASPSGQFPSAWKILNGSINNPSELTAQGWNGMAVDVLQNGNPSGDTYYFTATSTPPDYGAGTWGLTNPVTPPTPSPTEYTTFDPATMPRALVLLDNGEFQLQRVRWNGRPDSTAPSPDFIIDPEFVGKPLRDIIFHRNRLGLISEDTITFSGDGDLFRWWPDDFSDVVATDPFGLTNPTTTVSPFNYAVPFNRKLFLFSDEAQFEVSGDTLSATDARIEPVTTYSNTDAARPVVVGDEIYFASETGRDILLYAYSYDDRVTSETAEDVSAHAKGFPRGGVQDIAANSNTSEVFVLSQAAGGLERTVFTYKFHMSNRERAQSAWGAYTFDGTTRAITYEGDDLILLIERSDQVVYIETLSSTERETSKFTHQPRLDRLQSTIGTYDAVTDLTSIPLLFVPDDPVVLSTNRFSDPLKYLKAPVVDVIANPDPVTVDIAPAIIRVKGDWSERQVVIGQNFHSEVKMSRQFLRDGNGLAMTSGRLQLRKMEVWYDETGYFEVTVEPDFRDPRRYIYNGREIGSGFNRVQMFPIKSGKFSFLVQGDARSVDITLSSDEFLPFRITSATWVGFYNEISRQG